MNLIFSIYTYNVYKEMYLPALNDANYELFLRAGEFELADDLTLELEVSEGEWRFKANPGYGVFLKDAHFEGEQIQRGQLIQIRTRHSDQIAIMVWGSPAELTAFRKYRVHGSRVTIGKAAENAICYPARNVVSNNHAEILYSSKGANIRDLSKNGTYLENHRIQAESPLCFGNLINLYGLSILFFGNILVISCLDSEFVINSAILEEIIEPEQEPLPLDLDAAPGETVVHISPRNIPKLYTDSETIENVPAKREEDRKPAWMSILPPLTMVLPMLVGFSLMNNGAMGFGIVISAGSATMGVIWAIINYRFAQKERKSQEKRRLERYEEYLVQCTDRIRDKFEYNRRSLLEMYPDVEICSGYTAESVEIWARKPRHADFLYVRLGRGEMPFQVKISAPIRGFSMIDDELAERPGKIAQSYSVMRDVPLGVNLGKYNVVGILTGEDRRQGVYIARVMIAQLAANICYTDVKLSLLYRGDHDTATLWEYVRWLPHVWNEERSMRYIADDENGANDVLYALTQILRSRTEQSNDYTRRGTQFLPHYVLFVEDPAMLDSQVITKYLYENGKQLGITTVILSDTYENLPSACELVIERTPEFSGTYGVEAEDEERRSIVFDSLAPALADQMARRMSAMRVSQIESGSDIPSSLTFFDMLGVRSMEELNVLDHWRKNRTYETMRAVIGQKMGGVNCYLDINEKYHGPHGLVAGTTGSGKSETLQTYILSLAVNFSPLDVGFFIIDFKGGGMANLFSGLPHMIGQISNLSGNQVRRAMVSIKSENLRRQRIFSEFGVNHIDSYTKLVKDREATTPIPHLLIIIDEFAELKREEPEFMRELISVAQVGRSLGVHLILATQKPSGTVDENIWSNTKFKLCLRVADKQDSNDMLHKPDAAFLTQAGRCYLQVGNDELYELFQSGWSGAVFDDSGESTLSSAVLLDLQGREPLPAGRGKSEHKQRQTLRWMHQVIACALRAAGREQIDLPLQRADQERTGLLAKNTLELLNAEEIQYPENASNLRRLEEVLQLWPVGLSDEDEIAGYLIERFQALGKKLPERMEKTQLDAVVEYLAETAQKHGFINRQMLWMPLLPVQLDLTQLPGYTESTFRDGDWPSHGNSFSLSAPVGLVDDPENQMQYPLVVDLAEKGHLVVVGGVTSGKSTFLQSLIYSMINRYSPAELNVYAVDFSSQMLCAFENDPHVGGIVVEGEDEKVNKLFVMLNELLRERKLRIKGGSFKQYVQLHGNAMPAVIVAIDGYANFNEKTEGRFENTLLEFSRSAEGYGIYLVISCAGYGSGELQSKIANNMRQSICLELGDKYRYAEALRTMHFDVLPEENVKGRGLTVLDGVVLEYQTALACAAANDYERSELIRERCQSMREYWDGPLAMSIPTIPAKPVWEEFRALERYRAAVQSGTLLPVAYYQETAGVYSVDLSRTYCYLILGGDRSGKSTFLRNLMCGAKDVGGTLCMIDNLATERRSAELAGAAYVSTPEELVAALKELILLTNERAELRKQLRHQGRDDEEIYEAVHKAYPPAFYFIANLKAFFDAVYSNQEGIGKLSPWIEKIFSKGRLLNVYFFAAAGIGELPGMIDKPAYLDFIKEKSGVLMGGELNKQNIFHYQNIRYQEQSRKLKAGMGYAVNQTGEQSVDLIVAPNNKGAAAT